MLRNFLLTLSRSKSGRAFITGFPVARRVAARFVAGETLGEVIKVIRELNGRRIAVTTDHLGENVSTEQDAARAADDYLRLLAEIAQQGVQSHVSVKLTQFGLDLSEAICFANLRRVLDKAREINTFVRVDMEGAAYTERTLQLVRAAKEVGYHNVGAVIQAYLYRSEADLESLCRAGIRVRLCKGAYNEPPDKAFPLKKEVDANYIKLAQTLLAAARQNPGLYPALATHDEKMITAAKAYANSHQVPAAAFEFQMLYGIRRELQADLVAAGYNVRVYAPYGAEWYPYFMRRLAERPANLWFFLTQLFRR